MLVVMVRQTHPHKPSFLVLTSRLVEMLTSDLRKSNDNLVVNGKPILDLSTNLRPAATPAAAATPVRPNGVASSTLVDLLPPSASRQASTLGDTSAPRTNGFSDSQGHLPAGWERREDNLGRTYYVDHLSRQRQTTRIRPTSTSMPANSAPGSLRRLQDTMSTGPPRTSRDLDAKRFDQHVVVRPEWSSPDPSNGVLSDYQMQMMLLEQQNKKRLLMPRDSPTGQSDYNPSSRTSGKRDYSDYPPVPGVEYGNRGLTTTSNTIMKDFRGQTLKPPSPPPAFAQMSQQEQMDIFSQAKARTGLPPNSRLVSAARQNAESLFRQEAELRRRHDEQPPSLQQPKIIYPVPQQTTLRDATGFHSPVFGAAPTEMPGRPSRIKRRTQGPLAQSYSLPLPSNAHTKQVLAGVDKYLEQRRTRPRNREISSQLRGHPRDEPLMVGMSQEHM
jgi:hypothetical protein